MNNINIWINYSLVIVSVYFRIVFDFAVFVALSIFLSVSLSQIHWFGVRYISAFFSGLLEQFDFNIRGVKLNA